MIKQFIIATIISVISIASNAKAVAYLNLEKPGDKIVLHDEQKRCSGEFFDAMVTWQGRPLKAYWRLLNVQGKGWVHIVDEEGDQGAIPAEDFVAPKTI